MWERKALAPDADDGGKDVAALRPSHLETEVDVHSHDKRLQARETGDPMRIQGTMRTPTTAPAMTERGVRLGSAA